MQHKVKISETLTRKYLSVNNRLSGCTLLKNGDANEHAKYYRRMFAPLENATMLAAYEYPFVSEKLLIKSK